MSRGSRWLRWGFFLIIVSIIGGPIVFLGERTEVTQIGPVTRSEPIPSREFPFSFFVFDCLGVVLQFTSALATLAIIIGIVLEGVDSRSRTTMTRYDA